MAIILSVNYDCLHRILSFIDDPHSFHSIALTCKRFRQVINSTRNILHPKLLRAKAEYYIKCYIVDITNGKPCSGRLGDDYGKLCKLRDRLHKTVHLTTAKELLSYAKVVNVWQENGPVAAELFTWTRDLETRMDEDDERASCFTEVRNVTLHLPSCKKNMVISTKTFTDYVGISADSDYGEDDYDSNDDDDEEHATIRISCGDFYVKSQGYKRYYLDDYLDWGEQVVQTTTIAPLKPMMQLLQEELGDTVPPLTDYFFVWLCYFFPDMKYLLAEHKPSFKDPAKNEKPSPGYVQSAIEQFHQNFQADAKLKSLVSAWKNDDKQAPNYFNVMIETIHLLAQRSKVKLLEILEANAPRFQKIVADWELRLLPKQFMLDLILRTSLEERKYSIVSIPNKTVESRASLRCPGGKFVKLWGALRGCGYRSISWDELELEVTLPEGEELKFHVFYDCNDYNPEERPLPIGQLSPVTELLQECVNQNMLAEKFTPKITNLFTAVYVLHVLKFSTAEYRFLKFREGELFQKE